MLNHAQKSNIKNLVYCLLVLCLLSTTVGPLPAKAAAPTPPITTTQPTTNQIEGQFAPTLPIIGSPEFEEARVRESMEIALKKYLDYLGPRYKSEKIEVSIDGDWAYGITSLNSTEQPSDNHVEILAKRQQDNSWLAITSDNLKEYREFLDLSPYQNILNKDLDVISSTTIVFEDTDFGYQFSYPATWDVENTNYTGYIKSVSFYEKGINTLNLYLSERTEVESVAQEIIPIFLTSLPVGQNPAQEIIEFHINAFDFRLVYFPEYVHIDKVNKLINSLKFLNTTSKLRDIQLVNSILVGFPNSTYPQCPAVSVGGNWPSWGSVIVPESNWSGVDVYSNGGDLNNACPDTYGMKYQCVELAQRFFSKKWNYPPRWGVSYAAQMFDHHPSGTTAISNGGSPAPVWGDALVFSGATYGHVAMITGVSNGYVHFVEQNYNYSAKRSLPINQNNYISSSGTYSVLGWVHATQNGGSSSCSAPSLTSPANDHITTSNTLTFAWNPTTCSGQNGYYLRVGTSSGGNDVVNDYWVEGLQTNYTFGSQWNNRDLYWSVRANVSGGEWSGSRHFRIQPAAPSCSYTSSQIVLYKDGNYGGECVTRDIGEYSNPSSMGFPNDAASSIKVGGNVKAVLCEHDNYLGNCETFLSDDPNLGDNLIKISTSSLKVQSRVTLPSIPTIYSPGYGTVYTEGDTVSLSWSATGDQYYGEIWGGSSQKNFGPQSSTSINVTSMLTAGYNYEWKVKAQNSAGYSGWSNSSLFTIRPKAPTSLFATVASCSQINLNWSDNSGNEEGFRIYRNGTAIGTVGAGVTSYQNSGLSGNTSYPYYVTAFRGGVESAISNQVMSTTTSCVTVPGTPSLVSPSDGTNFVEGQSVVLSWSATGNQYSGEIWGGTSQVNFGPQSGTTKDVTSLLSAGYNYGWHVNAQNTAGTSIWSYSRTFSILPATPTNLVAQSPACTQVNLSWQDNSLSEAGYNVYRDGGLIDVLDPNSSYFVDLGLSGNTSYAYTVKAFGNALLSSFSNVASVTTQTCVPVDEEIPVVDWVSPTSNEQVWSVSDELIDLTVSATDNVGVDHVYYWRWDALNLVNVELGYAYTEPYKLTIDCSGLNTGWNQVMVSAVDTSGNQSDGKFIWLDHQEPKPNLVPYTPEFYYDPIVISSVVGTAETNELHSNQPAYIDVHFMNAGSGPTVQSVVAQLIIDDIVVTEFTSDALTPNGYDGFTDLSYLMTEPGGHFVELKIDPDNLIEESDETDNIWARMFYWTLSAPFSDDFESGDTGWVGSGLWHAVNDSSSYPNSSSGINSWWYGQEETGNYDTGETNSGDLTTPPIFIPETEHYYAKFKYWYQTETKFTSWDQRWIQASYDDGEFFNIAQLSDDNMDIWHNSPVLDLSGWGGHTLKLRLYFDTLDEQENAYQGWYIDDFEVSSNPPPTCADSCEYNNSIEYATPIALGQTITADICANGDYDYYSFDALAGDAIIFDIDAKVNGSNLDSFITLLSSDGTILSSNDDDGVTVDSKLGYIFDTTGNYFLRVRDYWHPSYGGPEFSYDITIDTDHDLPISAEITAPLIDEWLNSSLQTITANAEDLESGINRVEFLWHSADWENEDWIWLGSDFKGEDGWSFDFDISSLSEQQGAAFYIWAFDFSGNYLGAGSWNLGIDRTPPETTVNVYGIYGEAIFRDFTVVVDGLDNLSGIASYDVQIRDGLYGDWIDLFSNSTDNYIYHVGEDGHTYYFRSRARDLAGNEGIYAEGDGQISYAVQVCSIEPDGYEEDDNVSLSTSIAAGDTPQEHNFHKEGDQDWLSFTAQKDKVYSFLTVNTGAYADTVIHLFSTDGTTELMTNDDFEAGNYGSQIYWEAPTTGIYYLQINHYDWNAYGCTTPYTLAVTDITESSPFITNITPNTIAAGSTEITITVEGLNLVSGSVVRWNGIDLVTVYQNDNLLLVTIPSDLLLQPTVAEIIVFSPALGGLTSNVALFTVKGNTMYLPIVLR